jgi:hypothetical protein
MTMDRLTLTSDDIDAWVVALGYVEALPNRPGELLVVNLEGVVPTWETQSNGGILTHEGQLATLYTHGEATPRPSDTVTLTPATQSQGQLDGDDTILLYWMEDRTPRIAAMRAKVNADRKSSGSTKGAAQRADGVGYYWLSHFNHDQSKPVVFRPRKGSAVVVRDLNVDGTVTLAELVAGGFSLDNTSVLGHAMGLSEGCWGPVGGSRSRAWTTTLTLARRHLEQHPDTGLPVLQWNGSDLLAWKTSTADRATADRYRPMLRPGVRSMWVSVLQGLLIANGADLKVDAMFGPATAAALLDYRQRHDPEHTYPGVDLHTWERLLLTATTRANRRQATPA